MQKSALKISIKNFMSITDLQLSPEKITEIVGGNKQGKTSILKAIETTFTGSTNGALVKHGEDQAELIIELPDETRIRRVIKKDGKQNVTVKKGEFSITAPQSYLEALIDYRVFNPIDLLDPKNRKAAILQAINIRVTPENLALELGCGEAELPPVNFDQHGLNVLDDVYKYVYNRRAEANKDALTKKNEWEVRAKDLVVPVLPSFTKKQIEEIKTELNNNISETETQLRMAETLVQNNAAVVKRVNTYETEISKINLDIAGLEAEYQESLKKLAHAKELTLRGLETRLESGRQYLSIAKEEVRDVPDTEPFKELIGNYKNELNNLKVHESEIAVYEQFDQTHNMVQALEKKHADAEAFATNLSDRLAKFSVIKTKMMETAEMPVPGLVCIDNEFYIGETPLDLISTAQSVQLSVGVARMLASKTKLICIDRFESLDDATRAEFLKEIQNDDFTYFLTKVGAADDGVSSITMKEGAAV